tara:strand:+ start:3217 stop:3612 length:396 start_codon:yes stop_codon:yes gene_type:complete
LVKSCLLEYSDWCYETCESHPADLIVEFGNALYKIQVKARNKSNQGKYTFPNESHRSKSETHRNYHCDIYAFVFFPEKRILFIPNSSGQRYFVFQDNAIVDNMEYDSLQETLATLSQIPIIDNLLDLPEKH